MQGEKPLSATARVKAIQRSALAMLVVAGVINYIDRATLAVANPLIRAGTRPVDRRHGLSALGLSVGLRLRAIADGRDGRPLRAAPVADAAARACGRSRRCSAGSCRISASSSARASLLGIGEAPQFPTGARVVRDWFNPRDRGLATGIFNCASSLGTAIAVPLLTFLMLSFGWRSMFVIMGAGRARHGERLVSRLPQPRPRSR